MILWITCGLRRDRTGGQRVGEGASSPGTVKHGHDDALCPHATPNDGQDSLAVQRPTIPMKDLSTRSGPPTSARRSDRHRSPAPPRGSSLLRRPPQRPRPPRSGHGFPSAPREHRVVRPGGGTTRAGGGEGRRRVRSPRRTVDRRAGTRHAPAPRSRCRARAASTASSRKIVRRSSGSTRVRLRSGRAIASTIPGSPAPEPTSHTRAPRGRSSSSTAQLRRCRSHSRAGSRGPTRPRSTPSVASS